MNKFCGFLLMVVVGAGVVAGFAGRVAAAEGAVKIHDAATLAAPSVSGVGRVVDWGVVSFTYEGERVVLSREPDGTGDARIGDVFQLIISQPGGGSKKFEYVNHNGSCTVKNMPVAPQDVTSYFGSHGLYNVTWRYLDYCGGKKQVDQLYLVLQSQSGAPVPSTAPTPTVTPSPTPAGPTPFLRLPWEYEKRGLTFGEAALRMSAFFDHEYPFLSAARAEPEEAKHTVVTFRDDVRTTEPYTSHDGYDYAFAAGARLGDPVLAAAAGRARFVNSCPACGNAIHIDHGNNYQTRYYHLGKTGLITSTPGEEILVTQGQQIGVVGATGNVMPAGDRGAHLHFMVIEDKDRDGNFDDNIPDGVTDPYGWKPSQPDPWDMHESGNSSAYLWQNSLDETVKTITSADGGTAAVHNAAFTFDPDSYPEAFTFSVLRSTPVTYGDTLASVGNSIIAHAVAGVDIFVDTFYKLFTIEMRFTDHDLAPFAPGSLAIYSSQDGTLWVREDTVVNFGEKKATARVDHLSHFALMGTRKDTQTPILNAAVSGAEGSAGYYRSEVIVSLTGSDRGEILPSGMDYILTRVDGGDWNTYINPITFRAEGEHIVEFIGADLAGNVSEPQSVTFIIDTTVPEAVIAYDSSADEVRVTSPDTQANVTHTPRGRRKQPAYTSIQDTAGNVLKIFNEIKRSDNQSRMIITALQYNDDEVISLSPVRYVVIRNLAAKKAKQFILTSSFAEKNIMRVQLSYNPIMDLTKIVRRDKGSKPIVQTLPGMLSLQAYTDRGTVKYMYE